MKSEDTFLQYLFNYILCECAGVWCKVQAPGAELRHAAPSCLLLLEMCGDQHPGEGCGAQHLSVSGQIQAGGQLSSYLSLDSR